jgi:hypothetical protein
MRCAPECGHLDPGPAYRRHPLAKLARGLVVPQLVGQTGAARPAASTTSLASIVALTLGDVVGRPLAHEGQRSGRWQAAQPLAGAPAALTAAAAVVVQRRGVGLLGLEGAGQRRGPLLTVWPSAKRPNRRPWYWRWRRSLSGSRRRWWGRPGWCLVVRRKSTGGRSQAGIRSPAVAARPAAGRSSPPELVGQMAAAPSGGLHHQPGVDLGP